VKKTETDRVMAEVGEAGSALHRGAGHFPTMILLASLPENKLGSFRRSDKFSDGRSAAVAWFPKKLQCAPREGHLRNIYALSVAKLRCILNSMKRALRKRTRRD
jgi:hypothetical protein